ncbi:hypothetical protein GCM10017668_03460 [Streptomyces tuirus]|uniref:Insertion element IS402-like domain-containing protein n=1 Tax=Streptomyces tuirus TaxID=68278 RepID=A0A7G1N611_9ACTN|nr:hypothetical protein GCM10017668_03460 [Streptomyces tuirus]
MQQVQYVEEAVGDADALAADGHQPSAVRRGRLHDHRGLTVHSPTMLPKRPVRSSMASRSGTDPLSRRSPGGRRAGDKPPPGRFALHTGIQWEYLPQELGFGSGMTCWRRLAAWNEAGVWDQLHQLLLNKRPSKNQLDWSRAVTDPSHVRAARRGPTAVPAGLTAPARSPSAGSSSGRSPGCTASAACASAGNDATTSTKPSSASPSA